MTSVINIASEGIYTDANQQVWTYFQDNDSPSTYYIVPAPAFLVQNGTPQFHITQYVDTAGNFLSAQCQLTSILSVPNAVIFAVHQRLQQKGVASPSYQAMPFIDVVQKGLDPNQAFLNYADSGGTVSRTVQTVPSLSGSQTAIFNISNMRSSEVTFFQNYFSGVSGVGMVQVVYQLTAWAFLGGVTARVQFDAQAAYSYQRTYKWV